MSEREWRDIIDVIDQWECCVDWPPITLSRYAAESLLEHLERHGFIIVRKPPESSNVKEEQT